MSIKFDHKVAVITGAGRGLGRSYALELARRGARVVVNDLGEPADGPRGPVNIAQSVVDEITAEGGVAVADCNNVAEDETARKVIDTAVDNYGTVDVLINNAGILRDRSFHKMSLEEFDAVVKTHLYGAFYITRAAFPVMKENRYGRILLTTSLAGLYGNFGQVNYAAAKLGLVGFMNALKEEGKKHDILVNTIAPLASSRLSDGIFPPEVLDKLSPGFIASMVLYLCSEACTSTGHIISAGGGFYTRVQLVEGAGCYLGDSDVTPEKIDDNYGLITDMKNSRSFLNGAEATTEMWRMIES